MKSLGKYLIQRYPEFREFYSKSNKISFDKITVASKEKYNWICSTCGDEVAKTVGAVSQKGFRCSKCAHKVTAEAKRAASIQKHGSIADFPDFLKIFIGKNPENISRNSKIMRYWKCSTCPQKFRATPYEMPDTYDCVNCRKKNQTKKYRETILQRRGSLAKKNPKVATEWCGEHNKFTPEGITEFSGVKACWICAKCSKHFTQHVNMRTFSEQGCPSCGLLSEFEATIEEFLEDFNEKFVRNSKPLRRPGFVGLSHKGSLELDFYSEELKLAFEIQDFATHSRESDTEEGYFRFGPLIKKGPTYHELKRTLAREQLDTELIDIWQDQIFDGSYKEIISYAIRRSRDKIN